MLLGRPVDDAGFLLWPLLPAPAGSAGSVLGRVDELVARLLEVLASPAGIGYLAIEALLLGTALALWVRDGYPGLSLLRRSSR